ncbi:MAG: ester cyclase [Chloroflexota bacterium]|jgi:predicted ester cyclase|nr:ester cyclase [Anaerolineae bacterium]HMM26695.1 ester cyclase [Aggregatilineaceae bacterium]
MKRYSVRQGVLVVIAGGALGLAALAALALPPGTAQADPAGNKAVVEQLITDVALNGDDALFEEIFADDFAGHLPPSTGDWAEVTKIQMRDLITLTTRALSDLEITSDLLLAEGDLVAQRVTMRGTFASEFFDTPPTDVELETSFNILYRFNDSGQIAEQWIEFDVGYLTSEVGLTTVTE